MIYKRKKTQTHKVKKVYISFELWITPAAAPLQRAFGVVAVSQKYQNFKNQRRRRYLIAANQTLAQQPLPWGSWNLQFWCTLRHYYNILLSLSNLCSAEKRIFKEIAYINFTLLPPSYLPFLGWGVVKFTISLSHNSADATHQI